MNKYIKIDKTTSKLIIEGEEYLISTKDIKRLKKCEWRLGSNIKSPYTHFKDKNGKTYKLTITKYLLNLGINRDIVIIFKDGNKYNIKSTNISWASRHLMDCVKKSKQIGVNEFTYKSKYGTVYSRFITTIVIDGRRRSKSFSSLKYGKEQALLLALLQRRAWEQEKMELLETEYLH